MSGCTGPCNQGRLPCPTPAACGLEEPPEHDHARVVLMDLLVAAVAFAVVVGIVVLWVAL